MWPCPAGHVPIATITTTNGARMPIRRFRTALLATAAVTALAVTACGGGGSDGADDEIEGVDQGNSEQQDASASEEPQDDGVDRPEIVLPEGVNNVFEGWESDDPTQQAILNDARQQINAMDLAVTERDPEADYVSFYTSAEALVNGRQWIQGFIDNELTIRGTVRYLEPELEVSGDTATLNYCADESEAESVNIDSGEVLESDTHPEIFYSKTLRRDERGVWVTVNVFDERGDCS